MPIAEARYYKTLLICPKRQIASEVAPLVASALPLAPVHEISEYPGRKQLMDTIKSFDPKICLLDFATDPERAMVVINDLQILDAHVACVALLSGNDPDLILRCLRQGATDFLVRPFTADQVDTAFEKIAKQNPAPVTRLTNSRSVAIVPVKGGCGATTVACNLAFQAKRNHRTLLADLDALTGTVSFLLKLKSTYSFLDVLARHDTLDQDLWKQLVTTTQGFDVILPPDHLLEGVEALPDAATMIHSAQQMYEAVVIDCGSPYSRWSWSIAAAADQVLLVTTNELASMQSVQRLLAWYEQTHLDTQKVKLVVNRYHREVGLHSDAIGSALEAEILHLIPSDYESLQKCILEGKPAPGGTAFGKSIAALSEALFSSDRRSREADKSGPGKKGFSLFR